MQAEGLRAKVIAVMCGNFDHYKELDVTTVNADLLTWLQFSSVEDRIAAMADPFSLPRELAMTAAVKALNRPIVVWNKDYVVIQRYGEDIATQADSQ